MDVETMELRLKHYDKVVAEAKELFAKKNAHYDDDFFKTPYSDEERWQSIRRKVARIESFVKNTSSTVPDETIEDTWRDLLNYCIMEIMLREMKEASKPKPLQVMIVKYDDLKVGDKVLHAGQVLLIERETTDDFDHMEKVFYVRLNSTTPSTKLPITSKCAKVI